MARGRSAWRTFRSDRARPDRADTLQLRTAVRAENSGAGSLVKLFFTGKSSCPAVAPCEARILSKASRTSSDFCVARRAPIPKSALSMPSVFAGWSRRSMERRFEPRETLSRLAQVALAEREPSFGEPQSVPNGVSPSEGRARSRSHSPLVRVARLLPRGGRSRDLETSPSTTPAYASVTAESSCSSRPRARIR